MDDVSTKVLTTGDMRASPAVQREGAAIIRLRKCSSNCRLEFVSPIALVPNGTNTSAPCSPNGSPIKGLGQIVYYNFEVKSALCEQIHPKFETISMLVRLDMHNDTGVLGLLPLVGAPSLSLWPFT